MLRSLLAGLLGLLAVVGLLASSVAVWASSTLFDTDSAAVAVGDALDEPEVRAAVAAHLADLAVDLAGRQGDRAGRAAETARGAITATFEDLLTEGPAREALDAAVRATHTGVVALLEDERPARAVALDDGVVTLDLLPVLARGLEAAVERGILPAALPTPDLAAAGDPEARLAALEAAYGVTLPEGFGRIEVYRSPRLAAGERVLATARVAVDALHRVAAVAVPVTAVLAAGCLLVARRRARAAAVLAGAGAVALAALLLLVDRVGDQAAAAVAPEVAGLLVGSTYSSLTSGLRGALLRAGPALAVVGLVAAAVHLALRPAR